MMYCCYCYYTNHDNVIVDVAQNIYLLFDSSFFYVSTFTLNNKASLKPYRYKNQKGNTQFSFTKNSFHLHHHSLDPKLLRNWLCFCCFIKDLEKLRTCLHRKKRGMIKKNRIDIHVCTCIDEQKYTLFRCCCCCCFYSDMLLAFNIYKYEQKK